MKGVDSITCSIIDLFDSSSHAVKDNISKFSHHAFFYYLLTHSDSIRLFLCQWMNQERKIASTIVNNPMFPTDHQMMKSSIMDVVAIDEAGDIYNLEMQNYPIDEGQITRFLIYGGVLLRSLTQKGNKDYKGIGTVHQMLISNTRDIKGLHHFHYHFISYDPIHHVKQPYHKNDMHVFQLQHLDEIKEEDEELYGLLYLFQNDRPCDTIKMGKLVREVIEMHDAYIDSEAFWDAFIQEQNELQANTLRATAIEQGEQRGEKRGIRVGRIDDYVEYIMVRFQEDIREWLESLNEEELEMIRKHIFKVNTLEELKGKIK